MNTEKQIFRAETSSEERNPDQERGELKKNRKRTSKIWMMRKNICLKTP